MLLSHYRDRPNHVVDDGDVPTDNYKENRSMNKFGMKTRYMNSDPADINMQDQSAAGTMTAADTPPISTDASDGVASAGN